MLVTKQCKWSLEALFEKDPSTEVIVKSFENKLHQMFETAYNNLNESLLSAVDGFTKSNEKERAEKTHESEKFPGRLGVG